jgi:hypothetical protein
VIIPPEVTREVAALVAAAQREGFLRALAAVDRWLGGEEGPIGDDTWAELLASAADGVVTARGLRETAEADLLAAVVFSRIENT